MNRIYQGKVTQVEIPDSANKVKWLLFHRDSDRARELTGRIPELREQGEAEITERAGWSVKEQKRRPKSPALMEYEKLRAEERQQWQDALIHGDHTGYYTLPEPYPVFHVTAITHRKDAVYPATIVGIPPMEDFYIGGAALTRPAATLSHPMGEGLG